jgi:carbon-monoxide dehydrogenase iron sulfur subunit
MNSLKVTVTKILGECTSTPPMKAGDFFTVENGDIRIPDGGFVCAWALQNILPLLPAKERRISERRTDDWMWHTHHVQCPDPKGRVVFRIEKARRGAGLSAGETPEGRMPVEAPALAVPGPIRPLRVVVEEVRGKCTSGHKAGDFFRLDGGRLSIPAGGHFCLYALQAVLPFVAAKARKLEDGDWLETDDRFICPDPAGNVILRIEAL